MDNPNRKVTSDLNELFYDFMCRRAEERVAAWDAVPQCSPSTSDIRRHVQAGAEEFVRRLQVHAFMAEDGPEVLFQLAPEDPAPPAEPDPWGEWWDEPASASRREAGEG